MDEDSLLIRRLKSRPNSFFFFSKDGPDSRDDKWQSWRWSIHLTLPALAGPLPGLEIIKNKLGNGKRLRRPGAQSFRVGQSRSSRLLLLRINMHDQKSRTDRPGTSASLAISSHLSLFSISYSGRPPLFDKPFPSAMVGR